MSDDLATTTIPFRLRGIDGHVTVAYGVNEDPDRWGYPVLALDWYRPDLVRGFPVMQASVTYPAEGYAAKLGWLQVLRYRLPDAIGEEHETVFDVPPQLGDVETPYAAFGVLPTFFDAPSTDAKDGTWEADTFLVCTPDAVLSRTLRYVCGFTWGYRLQAGMVSITPLTVADRSAWTRNLGDLRERFTTWAFEDINQE